MNLRLSAANVPYNWGVVTDEELDALVSTAAQGDELAWQRLWREVEPPLLRILAQPQFLGRISGREDDRRNIVVAVMGRLRADDFHRLGLYLEAKRANDKLRFISWLRVVAKRVGIDYMRAHPDWVRQNENEGSAPGRWVDAGTLPPASQIVGERPPVTIQGTARELLQYAAGAVNPEQLKALQMWSQSDTFEDIAKALGLPTAHDAEKIVRAALERLRRHYRAV